MPEAYRTEGAQQNLPSAKKKTDKKKPRPNEPIAGPAGPQKEAENAAKAQSLTSGAPPPEQQEVTQEITPIAATTVLDEQAVDSLSWPDPPTLSLRD